MIPYAHLPYIVLATIAVTIIVQALLSRLKKKYRLAVAETAPIEIPSTSEAAMQVWQTVYPQAAETIRDQAKLLASTNVAGLAGSIAILGSAKQGLDASWLMASVLVFGVGLFISLMPITGLADKFKEDLSSVMSAMADHASPKIEIRHAFATGKRFYVGMLSLFCTGAGIFCLTSALLP